MSKIIYVVSRNKVNGTEISDKLGVICDALNPDHIDFTPSKVVSEGKVAYGISNPNNTTISNGPCVLFGQSFGKLKDWDCVGGQNPDGNYAIFRDSEDRFEVVSDILGTKAIWYYKDDDIFVASTSQRAIIQYLGNLQLNHSLFPWMICNGLLGPGQSWDQRISLIPPDSTLLLDKNAWKLSTTTEKVVFKFNGKKDKDNIRLMSQSIQSVFSDLSLDYSQWKLTLSGGYDSRGILYSLPKQDTSGNSLQTLTWGLKQSAERGNNDAYIAKKLASKFNLKHTYYPTDNSSEEPLEKILDRFFKNGEGRIDHLGGYMDGFNIWKKLFDDDVEGVIRGDEVFGSYNFISDFHLKSFLGLTIPQDYSNLDAELFKDTKDLQLPQEFEKKENESFETWRDRLYHSYLVPIFLSALGDLKQPYVEQINPLLSRKIVSVTRQLPDRLRTNKEVFKTYVKSFKLKFNYASEPAIKPLKDIFREKEMVELFKQELSSDLAGTVFKKELLEKVSANLQTSSKEISNKKNLILTIKNLIPKSIKRQLLKTTAQNKMDYNLIGFRLFLILRMVKILQKDAQFLQSSSQQVN